MSTTSHSIDPNASDRDTPAPEAAAIQAAPSRTGLWLLMILLAATFLGWYLYGKRAPIAPPAPLPPIVALPPLDRGANDAGAIANAANTANKPNAAKPASATKPVAAKPRATQARPIANRSPEPRYPAAALRRGEGGTVVLRVNVGADGVPDDIAVSRRSGSRDLDRAAMTAVRDWRFKPATRNGREVASVVEQPVEFRPMQ
ncbi:energy transducer TonB [Lysobacter capsici]|uniref:energy transducer TonB n=1 Tax=Lysobacter capsici TaxID=435897 RepID=UPI001C0078BD|nr:energy transducer TonB [Lysobacter capsici]QWF19105.1 energy transducer TonB [Lysobacter capsici]